MYIRPLLNYCYLIEFILVTAPPLTPYGGWDKEFYNIETLMRGVEYGFGEGRNGVDCNNKRH